MMFRNAAAAVAILATLTGCASHPRGFSPVMMQVPTDQAAFEMAFNVCSAEVAAGRRDSFRSGRGGSAAGGMAIGGVAALATGASAASGAGMLTGVVAGAGLAIGLVVFAPLAMIGVSRVQRANKEREIKNAMTACLAEEGYVVDDWQVPPRGATGLASPTRPVPGS
jgi:peptidoglycan/LPS O-acetylase OafA/YrhL